MQDREKKPGKPGVATATDHGLDPLPVDRLSSSLAHRPLIVGITSKVIFQHDRRDQSTPKW